VQLPLLGYVLTLLACVPRTIFETRFFFSFSVFAKIDKLLRQLLQWSDLQAVRSNLVNCSAMTRSLKLSFSRRSWRRRSGSPASDDNLVEHIRAAVMLPPDECYEEWIAMHTLEFFEDMCELYAIISPYTKCCPPDPTTAPLVHAEHLLVWIEDKLNDSQLFPTQFTKAFPHSFKVCVFVFSWLD
jgi:hypothetical protein